MNDFSFDQSVFTSVLLDSIGAMIIVLDEQMRILVFNRACEQLSGFTFEEMLGKNALLNLPAQERPVVHALITQLFANKGVVHYQNYWVTRTGQKHWIDWTHTTFTSLNNQARYILSTGIDTTERHEYEQRLLEMNRELENRVLERTAALQAQIEQSLEYENKIREREELYRSLAESAQEFIYLVDREGMIQYVNGYGAETFHLKPKDMIGKYRREFFKDDDSTRMQANLEKVFAGTSVSYHEDQIIFPERELWLGTRLVPIHDRNGNVAYVLGVSRDITERKVTELELKTALQKEKELNELRSSFVSMMSHQVGTPLSTILSSAEMLEHYGETWTRERRKKHLDRIIDSTRQVDTMVRDILELGRTEINPVWRASNPIDLVELCRAVIGQFQLDEVKNHEFVYSAPPYPVICKLDDRLIQQALENLLSNAQKFSPEGTKIELELSADCDNIFIRIDDQGIGISEQDLGQVGTPFYRASKVSRIRGTGVGLSLVKRAIDALGGTMEIASRENAGTSVWIRLPCNPDSFAGPLPEVSNE